MCSPTWWPTSSTKVCLCARQPTRLYQALRTQYVTLPRRQVQKSIRSRKSWTATWLQNSIKAWTSRLDLETTRKAGHQFKWSAKPPKTQRLFNPKNLRTIQQPILPGLKIVKNLLDWKILIKLKHRSTSDRSRGCQLPWKKYQFKIRSRVQKIWRLELASKSYFQIQLSPNPRKEFTLITI